MFLGAKVPWNVAPEEGGAAHGPHPPRGAQVPGDVNGFSCWFFVVVLVCFFACLSWVIRLSGWCLYGNSALQDSTRVGLIVCVPLFLFVWCVRRRRFSLFSFSQALGKPKPPSQGFGVPLVFLRPDRDHIPRPVLQAPQLHPGHLPHLFFSFVYRSRWVVAGLLLGVSQWFSGWGVLGRSVFRLGVLVVLVLRLLLFCILHVSFALGKQQRR